jgi:hypothetical protein
LRKTRPRRSFPIFTRAGNYFSFVGEWEIRALFAAFLDFFDETHLQLDPTDDDILQADKLRLVARYHWQRFLKGKQNYVSLSPVSRERGEWWWARWRSGTTYALQP